MFGIQPEIIRVVPKSKKENHKKDYVVIRYYNKLLKTVVKKFEKDFNRIIINSEIQCQINYIKGLIDSDGTIKDSGRIVIEMRPESYEALNLASILLNNLKIYNKFVVDEKYNLIRLTIYPNFNFLNFCEPIHMDKRNKVSTILGRGQGFHDNIYWS